ncbi:MAG TPA: hypothetical protein VF245_05895 [Solirubrobacterales bacterium]
MRALLQIALTLIPALIAGAIGGAFTARWLLKRKRQTGPTTPAAVLPDPSLTVDIERTAGAWANAQGRPEAKGLIADKLHLVHGIGQRRGWWQ